MKDADGTRSAARGLFSIAGAKGYFIVAGYALQIGLPNLFEKFGEPEAFGRYSAAMNPISIVNNVLIAGTVQTVSKLVSEDESRGPATLRRALHVQLAVGAVLAGIVAFGASFLARGPLHDRTLEPMLRVGAGIVMSYALYGALVGALNGERRFVAQARLDMLFSTVRTGAVLTAAALGLGALGAVSGFTAASVVVLVAALFTAGVGVRGEGASGARFVAIMLPLYIYQACLNGVMQIDLSMLKGHLAELFMAAGSNEQAAADLASTQVGYYRAAQTFAFVPYQLILSLTFVVFPMVSRATSQGDTEATRTYVLNAMRFSLLGLLAVAAPVAGAADGVMVLAYPAEYAAGSDALRIASLGMVCFAMFVIAATILSGSGRPFISAVIAAIGLVVVMVANRVLVGLAGVDGAFLASAATGTAIGTSVALILGAIALRVTFRAVIPPMSLVRALIAGCVGYAVAHYVPHASKITVLIALVAGGLAYLATLFVLREVSPSDLAMVKRLRKKR